MLQKELFAELHLATQVLNGSGFVSSLLQVYHCLVEYDKIQPWDPVDRLFQACKATLFPGGLPRRGQQGAFSRANVVSLVGDNNDGGGRGVLPMRFGGSLMGRLAIEGFTPAVVDALFPRHRPRQRESPRVGAPSNPTGILDVIKNRMERELRESALTLDLFRIQLGAELFFSRWKTKGDHLFVQVLGQDYIEGEDHYMVLLAGYCFQMIEDLSPQVGMEVLNLAAEAFEEVRQMVEAQFEGGGKLCLYDC